MTAYTSPPEGATTSCVDELGPVIPRTFPPAPGWSPKGHRLHAPLAYSRGSEKVWVYGALRVRNGHAITLTTRSRNTASYLELLEMIAAANPDGDLYLISDNLSSHKSPPIQAWLAENPRVRHVFIPVGACCSTSKSPGGACSGVRRSRGRHLPMVRRSIAPRRSPRSN